MNSVSTPRKRPAPGLPGSTPFSSSKFQSSLVPPMNRPTPSRSYHPPKNKTRTTGFSSNARDIFLTSTPQANRTSTFSPDIPPVATKMTPSARKFVIPRKTMGTGMSSAASTDLFKLRIPSPDHELTGEKISKQVPEDPNRVGTIYADQYLAHLCPAHFDGTQRRQFFCILDLRRLKYAADEIFLKKDYALNIQAFSREYERSRGLILLRYGLYEFKRVKVNAELLKNWRISHGLPDPVPESEDPALNGGNATARTPGTATKRKAGEDLASKDNTLAASTTNQNKRRNLDRDETAAALFSGPAPFKKSKRKADETDELDEKQPSKLQKQPPSAAKSTFESILDRAQTETSTPSKRPPLSTPAQSAPLGAQKAIVQDANSTFKPKPTFNPFATSSNGAQASSSLFGKSTNGTDAKESVLSAHKPGSALATGSNMFGYLSGSSANTSGNEKDDAEEDDDVSTEPESEAGADSQDAAPSYEPSAAASTGTSTPPAKTSSFTSKFGDVSASFDDNSNKSTDTTAKGGLFDRVKLGTDGQPMRANPISEGREVSSPAVSTPAAEPNKAASKTRGDFRFDPTTTPISFSPSAAAAASAKAATPLPSIETDAETPKPKATPKVEETPAPKTSSIFTSGTQATTTPAAPPPSKPLFGQSTNTFGQSNNTSDIFKSKPATNASFTFGAQTPAATPSQTTAPPATDSAAGLFGSKPDPKPASAPEQPKNLFGTPSTTAAPNLFGKAPESTPASSNNQSKNLFGTPSTGAPALFGKPAESTPAATQAPLQGLFGSTTPSDTTVQNNKRGLDDSQKPKGLQGSEPSAKKPMFGGDKPATTNLFGANSAANSPAASTGFTFGANNTQSPASSIFNSFKSDTPNGTNGTTQGTNGIFSATSNNSASISDAFKPNPAASAPVFGNASSENKTPSFTFGASQPAPTEQKQGGNGIFANSVATSGPSFEFRASSPATSPAPSFGNVGGTGGPSFEFKASSPVPAPSFGSNAGAPSFEFKASSPGPSGPPASTPGGRRIATPRRRLGTPGATPNTSFNTGSTPQPQQNASFGFGNNVNASGADSAVSSFGGANSNSGFSFQFGGNGQTVNNPFGQSSSQVTAPSSFGASFDQPKPSTPTGQSNGMFGMSNGTGGAPSFTFQSATPQQNTPLFSAPQTNSFFGNNLQPNGDSTMGASE